MSYGRRPGRERELALDFLRQLGGFGRQARAGYRLRRCPGPAPRWPRREAEKVQRFQALGIDWAVLPYRTYGEGTKSQQQLCCAQVVPWPWTSWRRRLCTSIRAVHR